MYVLNFALPRAVILYRRRTSGCDDLDGKLFCERLIWCVAIVPGQFTVQSCRLFDLMRNVIDRRFAPAVFCTLWGKDILRCFCWCAPSHKAGNENDNLVLAVTTKDA